MPDLSIIIPSRSEMFLKRTIEDILENMRGDTEIVAVCDGSWPDPVIEDYPNVHLIYHSQPIGQRAAVNEAAKLSQAKFIMKLDAHCAVDEGFDIKLMADCEYDWTVVPRMYNLHAFDWKCNQCGHQWYQGPTPKSCEKCDNTTDFERVMIWKPKKSPETDFMRFDSDLRFQYWSGYKKRPEAKGDICDLISCLGACWFMHRDRFWELDGLDEKTGSWGQMGTELACKSWLSGGRMAINKKTWFSHLFRTQGGDFGFPYKIHGSDQEKARKYSRDLWLNDKWEKAVRPLSWLIDKFAPIPDWSAEKFTKGVVGEVEVSGIYSIRCKANGKIYIGSSSDMSGCLLNHVYGLENGKHPNKRLQYSWNRYGAESFLFVTEFVCSKEKLQHYEQEYIDKYKLKIGWKNLYRGSIKDQT